MQLASIACGTGKGYFALLVLATLFFAIWPAYLWSGNVLRTKFDNRPACWVYPPSELASPRIGPGHNWFLQSRVPDLTPYQCANLYRKHDVTSTSEWREHPPACFIRFGEHRAQIHHVGDITSRMCLLFADKRSTAVWKFQDHCITTGVDNTTRVFTPGGVNYKWPQCHADGGVWVRDAQAMAHKGAAGVPAGVHAITGMAFILAGMWQFNASLRRWSFTVHRWVGRFYLLMMAVASISAPFFIMHDAVLVTEPVLWGMAFFAFAYWLFCAYKGYRAIRARNTIMHRVWMLRSFALGFSVIPYRMMFLVVVPLSVANGHDVGDAAPASLFAQVFWLSFVGGVAAGEVVINRLYLAPRSGSSKVKAKKQ